MLGGFDLHQIELDCRRKYGQGRSQHWPYKQAFDFYYCFDCHTAPQAPSLPLCNQQGQWPPATQHGLDSGYQVSTHSIWNDEMIFRSELSGFLGKIPPTLRNHLLVLGGNHSTLTLSIEPAIHPEYRQHSHRISQKLMPPLVDSGKMKLNSSFHLEFRNTQFQFPKILTNSHLQPPFGPRVDDQWWRCRWQCK